MQVLHSSYHGVWWLGLFDSLHESLDDTKCTIFALTHVDNLVRSSM